MPGSPRTAVIAATLMLTCLPSAAQTERFAEETSVVLIEIPVQVMRDGRPLTGLTAEEFRVYDRGREQKIIGFEAYDFLPASGESSADPRPSLAEPTDLPLSAVRRNLLFLFDFAYPSSYDPSLGAGSITAAVHGLRDNVSRFRNVVEQRFDSHERWAVALFSPLRGVKLVQDWTTRPVDLLRCADLLEATAVGDSERVRAVWESWRGEAQESRKTSEPEGEAGARITLDDLLRESRTAHARGDRFLPGRDVTHQFIDGMIGVTSALAPVAGPKSVVYLSVGFVSASLLELEDLYRWFRKRNWTIQSVSTGGAGYYSDALRIVANETGGQAYFYSHELEQLIGEMLDDTAATYMLAIQPEAVAADGSYHRLEVELAIEARGTRLHHRMGYFAPEPAATGAE